MRQLFSDQKQNPFYKAAFGINRFQNIRRHVRFDDKRTRQERLKHDKMAAISYIWGLFIENCKSQFSLGAYATVDEQLVPFRGRCPFKQYIPSKPAKYGIKVFWLCDAYLPYASKCKGLFGKTTRIRTRKKRGTKCCYQFNSCTSRLRKKCVL